MNLVHATAFDVYMCCHMFKIKIMSCCTLDTIYRKLENIRVENIL